MSAVMRKASQAWRERHLGLVLGALAATACSRLGVADSQAETITFTSPESNATVHAGGDMAIKFGTVTTEGNLLTGPFDVHLYNGLNEVHSYCSVTDGCAISNGSFVANIFSTSDPGVGYTFQVTDRTSSDFGATPVFTVLAELPSSDAGVATPQYEDDVEGAGAVGNMSLAMVIVAAVCGAALVATICAACCMVVRRRKQAKSVDPNGDLEDGGSGVGESSGRGFSVGTSHKGQQEGRSQRSVTASPARRDRAVMVGHSSPGRTRAMGEKQRGRPLERESPGRRMYRRNPGRSLSASPSGGSFKSGGGMANVTPGVSSSGSARPRTPQRPMSNNRGGPQSHGPLGTPRGGYEGGARMMNSKSPGREPVALRPLSAGRLRGGRSRTPRSRRRSSSRESQGSGGHHQQEHARAAVRRSRSDRYGSDPSLELEARSGGGGGGNSGRPPHGGPEEWDRQEEEGEEAAAADGARWADRGATAASGRAESGGRRGRSPLSSASRSSSMPIALARNGSDSSGKSARTGSTTPSSRQEGRRSRSTEGNSDTPPDVSWEELRSTHIKSKARVRKSYALPSYGDVVRAENDLNDDHSRPPPPCYSPHDADNALRLSIGIPDFPGPGSVRAIKSARIARPNAVSDARRGARTPGGLSSKTFDRNLSPGTRAVNARRAARNAQLSAEKALAAAAMASRAADLAAQAALEAEDEAEIGRGGGNHCTEVEMSPLSKPSPSSGAEMSLVREKIKVFSGGSGGSSVDSPDKVSPRSSGTVPGTRASGRLSSNRYLSRGDSQTEQREVKIRTVRSSASGSRPDKSWVKSGVKGPDTAGGSSSSSGGAGAGAASMHYGDMTSAAGAFATPTPAPLSSNQRRAFVKQYTCRSVTSDFDGESDFSLRETAAAAAMAATFGAGGDVAPASGHERRPSSALVQPAIESSASGVRSSSSRAAAAADGSRTMKNNTSDSDSESPRLFLQ